MFCLEKSSLKKFIRIRKMQLSQPCRIFSAKSLKNSSPNSDTSNANMQPCRNFFLLKTGERPAQTQKTLDKTWNFHRSDSLPFNIEIGLFLKQAFLAQNYFGNVECSLTTVPTALFIQFWRIPELVMRLEFFPTKTQMVLGTNRMQLSKKRSCFLVESNSLFFNVRKRSSQWTFFTKWP